ITAPEFVGLANFTDIATDRRVGVSFANTAVFVVFAVLAQLAIAMLLAVLVQGRMPGWLRVFFRSTFFCPLGLSAARGSILMRYLFIASYGVVTWALSLVGIPVVPWLTSPQWALVVVIAVYVWQNFGSPFLLFIGGPGAIPARSTRPARSTGPPGGGSSSTSPCRWSAPPCWSPR